MSCQSGSMHLVIRFGPGEAPPRAVVPGVPGRGGNAARGGPGAEGAIRGLPETASGAPPEQRAQAGPLPPDQGAAASTPPSMVSTDPLQYDASSEARNSTPLAISIGLPVRPVGFHW